MFLSKSSTAWMILLWLVSLHNLDELWFNQALALGKKLVVRALEVEPSICCFLESKFAAAMLFYLL